MEDAAHESEEGMPKDGDEDERVPERISEEGCARAREEILVARAELAVSGL